jgi:FkbM family methyltransferase
MHDYSLDIIERDWPRIEQSILQFVEDWSVCVQAGGHKGLYPKKLAKLFDTVYTFEPYYENYTDLIKNCTEENIIPQYAALGAYEKRTSMLRTQQDNSGNILIADGDDVDMITIDSLSLNRCGLIQLDIEKYEMFALMGAMRTIETFKPVIIIEGPETTNNTCNHILDQLGYRAVDRAGYDTVFKFLNAPKPFCEYTP